MRGVARALDRHDAVARAVWEVAGTHARDQAWRGAVARCCGKRRSAWRVGTHRAGRGWRARQRPDELCGWEDRGRSASELKELRRTWAQIEAARHESGQWADELSSGSKIGVAESMAVSPSSSSLLSVECSTRCSARQRWSVAVRRWMASASARQLWQRHLLTSTDDSALVPGGSK
ncbi:hypothetical protein E2562_016177 [Oryza meyeriana var. granulata]|uniref:Uncharacterized protein n=1 Tax=Oryza meyeriana var. granulata TaxID=110450 RepID=A0A6G1F8I5_9ORYZ|nr:hypothetical protein E2562_016177 [Oryza meyeriana var. granulata]